MTNLPYGRQTIDDDDIAAVTDVLKSDWLTTGPKLDEFELDLATTLSAKHVVACSNGTAALHLTMLSLHLKPGDQVIVPTLTFGATANSVVLAGGEVQFADVDPDTGLMHASHFYEALSRTSTKKIKAVVAVHYAGQCVDNVEIGKIASDNGIPVIEDSAHALGTKYTVGKDIFTIGACTHSKTSIFSFHPVKNITAGEGGAITTNDEEQAVLLRQLRNHGIVRDNFELDRNNNKPWYYEIHAPGFNYRISDIHCALGISQLKKLSHFVKRRQDLAKQYDEELACLAPSMKPISRIKGSSSAWHLYPVLIDFGTIGKTRSAVIKQLRNRQIGTQVHYIPLHQHPFYQNRYGSAVFEGATKFYDRVLSLPLFPSMSSEDVSYVTKSLKNILSGY